MVNIKFAHLSRKLTSEYICRGQASERYVNWIYRPGAAGY